MIIIGEKINGSIKRVAEAITKRDVEFIQKLAKDQEEAGANYIDVCAGTGPSIEVESLKWLIDVVQEVASIPLCLDSPSPEALAAVIPYVKKQGIINSVSEEGNKPQKIFPLALKYGWDVIALTINDNGIPKDAESRLNIARSLINKGKSYGISEDRIYIDPLVIALATDNQSMLKFIEVMHRLKEEFPQVKITCGLSNISFGLPKRKMINRHFLTIALYEGLDAAILDPLDREIMGTVLSTEVLCGRDRHCRNFISAHRKGLI
ncbi:methyltetrahydrofolate cobalamin methyltransferase [Neomoorella mulderi]|uniref:5-methyltetrahydrofolate:corrinoid/iron-sulfur protein co-methyltransferase n=1 Tax=Moorella mulderi DSM 14980 TaxID=1122241 RepID=A0A151AWH6_9FIRM|nr:methyltetrahydrofolate cobalamin methyltransferase [Moorella mulderi]KYH31913.1 5-methyltetrahydrofolate:corrinoid/iron-sulfur protein co-methyltransferase [Moorella mulderi DSM 14980]